MKPWMKHVMIHGVAIALVGGFVLWAVVSTPDEGQHNIVVQNHMPADFLPNQPYDAKVSEGVDTRLP